MSLKNRLNDAGSVASIGRGPKPRGETKKPTLSPVPTEATTADPFASMRARVQDSLFAELGNRIFDPTLSADQLQQMVIERLEDLLGDSQIPLSPGERKELVSQLTEDVLGYGPVQQFLDDPEVTEVMVNSTDQIYVERHGQIVATGRRFQTLVPAGILKRQSMVKK